MIKAIAFDLWETLITDTPVLSRAQEQLRLARIEAILTERGFGATAEQIDHAYRKLWRRCHELYWSVDRDVPCRRHIEHFLEALELDPASLDEPTLAALEHAYAHAGLDVLPALVDGATEVLRTLHERGFRLGLISNTGRTPGYVLRPVLDQLGLGAYLDVLVFSNEHGECKPQQSIFTELRRGLGYEPHEIAFVGDNSYSDVHGAQRSGMRGILFVPEVRGTAVAPPVEHGLTIVPDETIRSLHELTRLFAAAPDSIVSATSAS